MQRTIMKKILVMGPAMAEWSEIQAIKSSLQFLTPHYELDFVDPLSDINENVNQKEFFDRWRHKLENQISNYDILCGFSLGGVILQQCLDLFEQNSKPLIFFSVPSFSDDLLTERLNHVIQLIKDKLLNNALHTLNRYVFYPHEAPLDIALNNANQAALRLSKGLQFVLDTDARPVLQKTSVKYLHLIGEKSQLVNRDNVLIPSQCQLAVIPRAGMRILQNSPADCIPLITKFLEETV